uniref:Uncharacterized protein n=1 Tax=Salix viminalis TaxID=40686 RepID=A0A6N2NLR0_SALVM
MSNIFPSAAEQFTNKTEAPNGYFKFLTPFSENLACKLFLLSQPFLPLFLSSKKKRKKIRLLSLQGFCFCPAIGYFRFVFFS